MTTTTTPDPGATGGQYGPQTAEVVRLIDALAILTPEQVARIAMTREERNRLGTLRVAVGTPEAVGPERSTMLGEAFAEVIARAWHIEHTGALAPETEAIAEATLAAVTGLVLRDVIDRATYRALTDRVAYATGRVLHNLDTPLWFRGAQAAADADS